MGKGDRKTTKGKRFNHSYGNTRYRGGRHNRKKKPSGQKNMKEWSLERIYAECGRSTNTTNIIFKKESLSAKKYGQSIVGDIYYTIKERNELENNINKDISKESNGNIRFKLLIKNNLNADLIRELQIHGFPNSDILRLDCYCLPNRKEFTKKGIRSLPKQITISTKKSSFKESCQDEYNFYNNRFNKEEELLPSETIRYAALVKFLFPQNFDNKFRIKYLKEVQSDDFKYEYLELLYSSGDISDEDRKSFDIYINNRLSLVQSNIEKEFNDSGIKKSDIYSKHHKSFCYLMAVCMDFKPEVLLYSDKKIFWDINSFLHILFRHTLEFQFDKNYGDKDVIMYELPELRNLIKTILGRNSENIKEHFNKYPSTRYSMTNKLRDYFNGDYYELQINSDGLLETFYKATR
jgi:ribosomal small subunit protein bTHX